MANEDKSRMHPNSLKNLTPFDSEKARKAQKKGVAARMANKAAREAMAMSMSEWNQYKKVVMEENDMTGLDVMKVLMHRALMEEDMDTASDLAKAIAEFEQPKLARVEQRVEEVKLDEMSDEELDAKLRLIVNNGGSE